MPFKWKQPPRSPTYILGFGEQKLACVLPAPQGLNLHCHYWSLASTRPCRPTGTQLRGFQPPVPHPCSLTPLFMSCPVGTLFLSSPNMGMRDLRGNSAVLADIPCAVPSPGIHQSTFISVMSSTRESWAMLLHVGDGEVSNAGLRGICWEHGGVPSCSSKVEV